MLRKFLKYGLYLLQFLVGCVFVLSSLTKANDPLGMTILLQNYLAVAGISSAYGSTVVTSLSVLLALAEMGIGAYLLVGSNRRMTSLALFVFMVVMTIITLFDMTTNAVPECGCFGTALRLSNEASAVKNVVLLAASGILLWQSRRLYVLPSASTRVMSTTFSVAFVLLLSLWTWHTLPLVDFSPYKVGTDIMASMMGEYDVVDGKSVEIKAPTIFDFALTTEQDEDMTDEILLATDTVVLITVPNEQSADTGRNDRLNQLWDEAADHHRPFYLVIAGNHDSAERFKDRTGLTCSTLYASVEMLSAMVRANPGVVRLYQGRVVEKDRLK